ncbi:Formimidoylglutamase, partial [Dissostichus eleginoides]
TFLDLGHRSTGRSLPRCDKKYPANKQRAGAGGNPEHSEHRGGDRTLDHRGISFFYPKKGDVH